MDIWDINKITQQQWFTNNTILGTAYKIDYLFGKYACEHMDMYEIASEGAYLAVYYKFRNLVSPVTLILQRFKVRLLTKLHYHILYIFVLMFASRICAEYYSRLFCSRENCFYYG